MHDDGGDHSQERCRYRPGHQIVNSQGYSFLSNRLLPLLSGKVHIQPARIQAFLPKVLDDSLSLEPT